LLNILLHDIKLPSSTLLNIDQDIQSAHAHLVLIFAANPRRIHHSGWHHGLTDAYTLCAPAHEFGLMLSMGHA
jgi:hypothetical protein